MADDTTLQQNSTITSDTIAIPSPGPGQKATITLEAGQTPQLLFDPGTDSTQEFVGTDLVFTMENGAVLTFEDFAADINNGEVASIMLADGTVIPIEVLMAAWELEVPEVAAGETGTAGEYQDDMGAALDGINKLGPQDPDGLGMAAPLVLDDEQTPIINDIPTISSGDAIVDEEGLDGNPGDSYNDGGDYAGESTTVTGSLSYAYGEDGAGSFSIAATNYAATWDSATSTLTANDGSWKLVDNQNGTYTFYLLSPMTHATANTEDDFVLNFTATITDENGDSASSNFSVTVDDDAPTIDLATEQEVSPTLTVDETVLTTDASADFSVMFTNASYGADGPGTTTYSLSIIAEDANSGIIDTKTGENVLLTMNEGVVEGRTETSDLLVFTVSVDGSGTVTLDQQRAVVHDNPNDPDESNEPTTLGSADLITLTATITDSDGDSSDATVNIGDALNFEDDGPVLNSVMDAVASSTSDITFTGLYDADFGSDGLDVMSIVLAAGGYYEGEPVTFVQQAPIDGVTKVNVMDGEDNLFSFYYTTTSSPVSDGGDGSVVFNTFTNPNDPDDSQFFVLTVNGDGTYNFDIVSNTALTTTTVTGEDFTAFGPIGQVATADESLIISGMDYDPDNDPDMVNASHHGIGVDNPNITVGEWVEMAFPQEDQSYVSFELQQWEGSGESLVHVTIGDTVFDDLVLSKPTGGDLFMEVIVTDDSELVGTWTANATESAYTLYVGDEFDSIRIDHIDDVDGRSSFNLNNITYDLETTIDDFTVDFTLSTTDLDGDSDTLADTLTVAMISPEDDVNAATDNVDADSGVVLVGNGEDDVLIGGDGDDILLGGDGYDAFVFSANGGEGNDTIVDFDPSVDKLSFADLVDTGDVGLGDDLFATDYVDVSIEGDDLVLTIHDPGEVNADTVVTLAGLGIEYSDYDGGTLSDVINGVEGPAIDADTYGS